MRSSSRFKGFAVLVLVLTLCFSKPLYALARYAAESDLYSHILLIPVISLYLVFCSVGSMSRKKRLPLAFASSWASGLIAFVIGSTALGATWVGFRLGWQPKPADYLALTAFSFLAFLTGGLLLFLGRGTLRALAFPIGFLVFMVPFPTILRSCIEIFFQHSSAETGYALLRLSGAPVFRHGLEFQLPGITIKVAQQCSGVHSSLVLFITSLLAGYLFLRTPWKRAVLVLAVIPLAILRNGLRICTIGLLCVHVSPDMIDSPIHHRGGPIFFVLSLVPFFLLLWWLRKSESRREHPVASAFPSDF